jgi:hypothetical protein
MRWVVGGTVGAIKVRCGAAYEIFLRIACGLCARASVAAQVSLAITLLPGRELLCVSFPFALRFDLLFFVQT